MKWVGDLTIIEYGPGGVYMGSKTFVAIESGYAAAMAEIERIIALGHRAAGDAGKVMAYFGR